MKAEILHKNKIISLLFICIFLLIGCSYSNIPDSGVSKYGTYFDTYVSITLYGVTADDANPLLEECFKMFGQYESMFSAQIEGSDIFNINNSSCIPVHVNKETLELIEDSLNYSKLTDGLFDITVYSILQYYDFHEGNEKIPSKDTVSDVIKHINYKNITINHSECTVTLTDSGTKIDIGGIAKGFIADKIFEYLSDKPISGGIINIGGDISTMGTKKNGESFQIGISDPTNASNTICGASISDKSIATSGTYIRSFYLDGEFYHHIINPKTGYPVKTDLISTTVISEKATDCDTLCTILILLGSRDALTYIESIPDTEAILIKEDGTLIKSSGADNYIIH